MLKKYNILQQLLSQKLVAVIRGNDYQEATDIAKAVRAGGLKAIELTYTTPQIAKVFDELFHEDMLLGAGSVLDAETARLAMLSGANFVVSPHFNAEIATMCNRYSIPYIPGCMTLTEISKAIECGSEIIKLFPASEFEPKFISSIQGPFPNISIMPTGGINQSNIEAWLDGGAVAAGIGSDLTRAYHNGGKRAVAELVNQYLDIIQKRIGD